MDESSAVDPYKTYNVLDHFITDRQTEIIYFDQIYIKNNNNIYQ